MEKIGIITSIMGAKKPPKEKKSFRLLYDKEKPFLYSYAKITIGDIVIATDKAAWDTGATITVISHSGARMAGTKPDGTGISTSATTKRDSDIYHATIELPGGIIFRDVELWDMDLTLNGPEVLIGMDIISQGRLVVENVNGIPMFSFEIEQ